MDAPQAFSGYEPGNFQASFTGPVSVSEALQRSLNVPAVDLLDERPGEFDGRLRRCQVPDRTNGDTRQKRERKTGRPNLRSHAGSD